MITLYAIVGARPRRALGKGVGGRRLALAEAGGAWVVVEPGAPPEPSARAIRAYDRIEKQIAAAASATLPFRFGSSVRDEASLEAALAPVTDAVARALALVAGCVQMTLRVYGEAAPPAPAPPDEGPGTRWLGARLAARRAPEIASVTRATKPFVRAEKTVRHDRPPLVATVFQLVAKKDLSRHRAALERSSRTLEGVVVRTSGPWPAYAFAELA